MRKYLSVLKDSFYETLDYRIFFVLILLSAAVTFLCLSMSYPRQPADQTIRSNLNFSFEVRKVGLISESKLGRYDRYQLVLTPTVEPKQFIQKLNAVLEQLGRERAHRGGQMPELLVAPATREGWAQVVERFLSQLDGFEDVHATPDEANPPQSYTVDLAVNWPQLPNAHRIHFLFGLTKYPVNGRLSETLFIIQYLLVEWLAGWAGVIVAVVVTAGFIPNMLRSGTVDLLLVRAISRRSLLLFKYLGGLAFVFLNSVVLVTGTWLAFGLRTGVWSPWYLTSILVLTFYFGLLYSLSVFLGVWTRSALVAILVTLGFWAFLSTLSWIQSMYKHPRPDEEPGERIVRVTVTTLHTVLPKPGDLAVLDEELLMRTNELTYNPQRPPDDPQPRGTFSWVNTLCTSAGFLAVMLFLACWRFSRMDY
jgi:hypothetical protein